MGGSPKQCHGKLTRIPHAGTQTAAISMKPDQDGSSRLRVGSSFSPGGHLIFRTGSMCSKLGGGRIFFSAKLFEQLPRSQCKLRTKGAYGVLAKRQPARGARNREVQHVTQRERVWRNRERRHGPDSKRGAGDGSLQGNRQHTPPAARPALGCSGA